MTSNIAVKFAPLGRAASGTPLTLNIEPHEYFIACWNHYE